MRIPNSMRAWPAAVASCRSPLRRGALLLGLVVAVGAGDVMAHGGPVIPHRVAALEVRGELPPPPSGVASIKFGEFFRMPIGPRGLEPTEKLMALNGKPVRLVGYMVREENPTAGRFLFSPLRLTLGDEDESLSDDLPATTVFVHFREAKDKSVPYITGLIQLTGLLEVGAMDEADDRVSAVRLVLNPQTAKRLWRAKPVLRTSAR